MDDYKKAPQQRQTEILHALTFWAMDDQKPELVRANCVRLIRKIEQFAPAAAKIKIAKKLETRIGRRPSDLPTAQVALACGAFPFIHKRQQESLVNAFLARFEAVKPDWHQHPDHGELLDNFIEAGGFSICPTGTEWNIIRWMVYCYIGKPGRTGTFGRNRAVFYSDTAASRIEKFPKKPLL